MHLLPDMDLTGPQLTFLLIAAGLAGLVRGFAGFGTAMIYMPIAGQILPPIWAIATMVIMDVFGPLPNLPRAWRDGTPRDVARLALGMVVTVPLGIYALTLITPEGFRYAISVFTLVLLVLLISGLRYRGRLTSPLLYVTGAVGGFAGGATGLAGPPVIMLYMSSTAPAAMIRGNLLMTLVLADVIVLAVIALKGELAATPMVIGLVVMLPYLLANVAGAAMFNPDREGLYRRVAYVVIAASAISGLPFWG